VRTNPWDAESIRRFWDRQATDSVLSANYFGRAFAGAISNVLRTELRGEHVLDFGCGPGFVSERLLADGLTVTAVDQSPDSVAAAEERCSGVGWRGAHVGSGDLPKEAFDGVICIETIEHLDDDALGEVLAEIRRLLRPGGVVLFTTPNDEDLSASLAYCPFCDTEFHAVQHVRSWTPESVTAALVSAGFEVRKAAGTELEWWQTVRENQWLGVRRFSSDLVNRLRHRANRFSGGRHLVVLARRPSEA
jgi:2-polyprenyl-3-methyl-5-hydroxy-6-metoxy-1,4-benzoquinol methylase